MILILVMVSFLCADSFAETVLLKSGKTVQGRITEDTDAYIKLDTPEGQSIYFNKNTISDIKSDVGGSGSLSTAAAPATGLIDRLDQGYLLFVPKEISPLPSLLVCLPGWGVKIKQEINNWAFLAGKKGFLVLGLEMDYSRILTLTDVNALYSRMSGIIDSLGREYHINKDKICVAGTSAGGMMSISLVLHYPRRFVAAGVVSGGRFGFFAQEELRNARGSRFFMAHGDKDQSIPFAEFQATRQKLARSGALIEYSVIPEGKHTLGSNAYRQVVEWLSDSVE